jgi:hypothetical protein
MGKPEGKRPLGRARHRWVNNIKMNLRQIGWDGMDWLDLTQDRDQWRALVNMVMNCGNLPQCKTDNSHSAARAGDIYTPHLAVWLSVHQHKRYQISAHRRSSSAHWLARLLAAMVFRFTNTLPTS